MKVVNINKGCKPIKRLILLVVLGSVLGSLGACGSDGGSKPDTKVDAGAPASEPMSKAMEALDSISESLAEDSAAVESKAEAAAPMVEAAPAETESTAAVEETAAEDLSKIPPVVEPLKMVAECKSEPYVKLEEQARESIKLGWQATQDEKFGVGFRNAKEYKKWGKTHNDLFKTVAGACDELSACSKKYGKNSKKKCATKARRFSAWQTAAKGFVDKLNSVKVTQPPVLCSMNPSSADPSECYSLLADRISESCVSGECLEVSTCFQGLGFLDDAINQAESACKFVHTKLDQCRGYVEATGRRQNEFDQCAKMYQSLTVEIIPVL
ncbi:MAG: hypothetical protein OEZ68_11475 [Gammaproteobacteria bacterium]|nr:hypothetical protein [Gammaproteobacteria bacterium]MDH5801413.1 hypothetical protein [Gammaproteobacteria bacterium]